MEAFSKKIVIYNNDRNLIKLRKFKNGKIGNNYCIILSFSKN